MKRFWAILIIGILACSLALSESATSTLQEMYAEAELLMVQGDYMSAAAKFESLSSYSDASQMAMYCKAIHAAENLNMYSLAIQTLNDLKDFKDSSQLSKYYEARSYEESGAIEDVDSASESTLTSGKKALETAIKIYSDIPLFRDSFTRVSECQTRLDLYNSTISAKKKDAENAKKESAYTKAKSLLEKKQYVEAYNTFIQIKGYKDVNSILSSDEALIQVAKFTVGKIITFGEYEQDGNSKNGKEALQWIVLDVNNDGALLLSKYVLDFQPYCDKRGDATWETCSLRKWINSTFYSTAFNDEEKEHVQETKISNHGKLYRTSDKIGGGGNKITGGNDTTDKVFLMSYEESEKYLPILFDANLLNGIATDQLEATVNIQMHSQGKALISWALRSPGERQDHSLAINVSSNHKRNFAFYASNYVTYKVAVRPAFWYKFN